MGSENFLIFLNLAICSFGGWICICRMSKMNHKITKIEIRWQYALWFSLLSISGWSFLFGDVADTIQTFMSMGIVSHLIIGVPAWKSGMPEYVRR